jgi:hypothetical protein
MIAHGTTTFHLPHGHPIATVIVIVLFVGLCAYWGYTSNRNKIY